MSVPCLPLTRRAGLRARALLHALRAESADIGMRDAMQGAICLEAGLPLVTLDERLFARVPKLEPVHPDVWLERASG